jgi:hypothetical protein
VHALAGDWREVVGDASLDADSFAALVKLRKSDEKSESTAPGFIRS